MAAGYQEDTLVREMNPLLAEEVKRSENNIRPHKAALKELNVRLKTARGPREAA